LLAFQFSEWLEELKTPAGDLVIVESGAHGGQLAHDILTWLGPTRPALFDRLQYRIVEPSVRRRDWQRASLASFGGKVQWFEDFGACATSGVTGIIFSNELLDSFPVRRLGWDARSKKWFEWGVAASGEKFVWAKIELNDDPIPPASAPPALLEALPDNFTTEICPAATSWWRVAASGLKRGKLMTIDYGLEADDFFTPSRANGTLRAFYRHHFADNVLANAGEQDLTAQVHFSEIQHAGEEVGLQTEFFSSQAKFLTGILEKTLKDKSFGAWTSARGRQFQTLTHPDHLGRAFRVLVQSKE
ncbi:MAG: SAM-dependent methyltransferase, partial [Limisphaerales bacterium]